MHLKKRRFLLRSTESGQIGWTAGLFFLLFLGVLLCASLQMEVFRSSSRYLEDALALSNLASAIIDIEEYGISHKLVIPDPDQAYERYKEAIKGNLNLSDSWECSALGMISGPVSVVDYRIYNVGENDVLVTRFDENGLMSSWQETLGSAEAPNGVAVESTGVYSEIAYQVEGLFGVSVRAHKGKLVDVVGNNEQ